MIEVIKNNQKDEQHWRLTIDGQGVKEINLSSYNEHLTLYASLEKTSSVFFAQKVINFLSLLNETTLELDILINTTKLLEKEAKDLCLDKFDDDEDEIISNISLTIIFNQNKKVFLKIGTITLVFNPFWKMPFSLLEYANFVQEDIATGFKPDDSKEGSTVGGIIFPLLDKNIILSQAIQYAIEKFKFSHQKAFEELSKRANVNSLTTRFFNFPDEVRVPCEQYLLYFTEFLRDLGVNTTADIKHEAGEILFSVTPDNPNQALDKIRFALEVFLDLPKGEIIIVPDEEFEIAMLKAKANIDHLNSQLSLAKAEIRVKEREIQAFEATLETKDISIEFLREKLNQQKRLLNGEIAEGIIDIEPMPKDEDKEEFFDGVFALTQYEEKGFRVNLAQLYRKLKTYLKGE